MVTESRPRQFDVFSNTDADTSPTHPYLVVLQSSSLLELNTCVVAPLIPLSDIHEFERAWPEVNIRGARFRVAVPLLAAIPTKAIGTAIENLERDRYRLIAALDLVFTGI